MRVLCALVLALLPATSLAAGAPHSTSILLGLHPAPWRPPARAVTGAAGMRIDPETGAPAPAPAGIAAERANARALAQASVWTAADGTRHAVLAGAIRSYTIVRVGEDGRLVSDCVDSEAEAVRRVQAAGAPAPPKDAAVREGH